MKPEPTALALTLAAIYKDGTLKRPYAEQAEKVKNAILKLASDPDALDNFESYLSIHFDAWLRDYANTPETFACELTCFAKMFDIE